MHYIIATNNTRLLPLLQSQNKHVEARFVDGNIKETVFIARDLMLNGYCLVADPLAGRLERPSPYLSIFLKKSPNTIQATAQASADILRIEYFVGLYCTHHELLKNLDEKHMHDFAEIDISLIENCMKQVFGNSSFFKSCRS